MLQLYEKLCKPNGADWVRADLHIHTPASHDFKWAGLNREEFNEYKYTQAMIDEGLGLVAITDHASGDWVDKMKKAAKDIRRRTGASLVVLPGLEISVQNIHLVMIFPEDKDTAYVNHVLSQLAIAPEDRGKKETVCLKGVVEVIDIAHKHEALVFGAHCMSSDAGILEVDGGQWRIKALEKLDGLEVKPGQSLARARERAKQCGRFDGPILTCTDSHRPQDLRSDVTWVKLGTPSFIGLSQTVYEPEQRVNSAGPWPVNHPRILGFEADQGLYADASFRFNPHLNVLIGGRGAGKSAALDLIRFAFGISPRRAENLQEFCRRISGFLGSGGTIRVFAENGLGKVFCIERQCLVSTQKVKGEEVISFTQGPALSELIGNDFVALAQSPMELFPIEFYGQSEVLELTRKADDQLRLIDEHVDFGDLLEDEAASLRKLQELRSAILETETDIEVLSQEAAKRAELDERVKYLDSKLDDPMFSVRGLWNKENSFLGSLSRALKEMDTSVQVVAVHETPASTLDAGTPNPALMEEAGRVVCRLSEELNHAKDLAKASVTAAMANLNSIRDRWKTLDAASQAAFEAKLRELGVQDLQALHRELVQKRQALEHIRDVVEPKLMAFRTTLRSLIQSYADNVRHLQTLRQGIRTARLEQVDFLAAKLRGSVRIELIESGNAREYLDFLQSMYKGSGIVNAENQLASIVNKVSPEKLAQYISQRDEPQLTRELGVTPGTASKLISFPKREAVLTLPTIATPDLPRISLRRSGDTDFTPLGDLSYGERCSAILAIALLEKNKPLLIDQPEDELDHQFITDDIVSGIKTIKSSRQIIVASHNPNIPVLGDAELVIRLTKLPGLQRCGILDEGSLEEPKVLSHVLALEGGKDAFERRRRKYRMD